MNRLRGIVCALAAVAAMSMVGTGAALAQQKQVIIGGMCDRTGPTQVNGIAICPGINDYYELVNSKGGVDGWKIKYMEIDHEYKVPAGVEAYQVEKKEGAVSIMVYGTPQVQALIQTLTEDKIPGTSLGFGIAASADGKRFPYLFPIAATYWSQGAAAVQFVKEKLGGKLEGKKLAYIFYDNPAGREPIPVIEDLQKIENCPPSRCRCRGSKWARRCSTSPNAIARFRDRPSVRPLAVAGNQGIQAGRLPLVEGDGARAGLLRARHHGGRGLAGRGRLLHADLRRHRRRLPGAPGNPGHVQGPEPGTAKGDG